MVPNIHEQLIGEAPRVLELLGIDEAALHRHIRCPLPNHADLHPSFRVNGDANCYYCTCTPRGGSLVDLVIAMQKAIGFRKAVSYLRDELRLEHAALRRPLATAPTPPTTMQSPTMAAASAIAQSANAMRRVPNEFDEYLKRCVPAHQHPYCHTKKIAPVGAHYDRVTGNLALRLHDVDGVTTGIQLISPAGNKWFAEGSKMRGNGLLLGTIEKNSVLGICEGWATGVTIFSLGNQPVLVTFSANNLLAAAEPYKRPWLSMVVFGDIDRSGVGQQYAHAAAAALGAGLMFPPTDRLDCDFNDLYVSKILGKTTQSAGGRHE